MTSLFEGYDEEFKSITSTISTELSELSSYDNDDKALSGINHIGDLFTQASQLMSQMELEVRGLEAPVRRELGKKVTLYKNNLTSLKSDYKKLKEKAERSGLITSNNNTRLKNLSRMEEASDTLNGTSDRIALARATVAETEEVALEITSTLGQNREKIEATHAKVRSVNSMTRLGGSIINRMSARNRRQKILIYLVMVFIVIAITLVIYFGFFGDNNNSNNN